MATRRLPALSQEEAERILAGCSWDAKTIMMTMIRHVQHFERAELRNYDTTDVFKAMASQGWTEERCIVALKELQAAGLLLPIPRRSDEVN